MTAPADDLLAAERARSAAVLAALHDELDAVVAERDRLLDEVAALTAARDHYAALAASTAAEMTALRDTRAVRWAERVRGALD